MATRLINTLWIRFLLFSITLASIYFLAFNLFFFFYGGPSFSPNDIFPLFPPILMAYFLGHIKNSPKRLPSLWNVSTIGYMIAIEILFWGMSYLYYQQWMNFETFYLIPFFILYFILTHLLLFLFYSSSFIRKNLKALIGFSILFAITLIFYLFFQFYWYLLAGSIILIVGSFLSLFVPDIVYQTDLNSLSIDNFSVYVGASCIGLNAFFLYFFLYSSLGWYLFLDRNLNIKNYMKFGLLGLVLVASINLIRIALFMLIGAYKSSQFAFEAFHSFSGLFFFTLLILVYLRFFLKKIRLK
jgi:exosortase/archaeosortase family protein